MQKAASEVYCKSNFLNEAFWYNGDKEYFSEWNVNVKKKTMLSCNTVDIFLLNICSWQSLLNVIYLIDYAHVFEKCHTYRELRPSTVYKFCVWDQSLNTRKTTWPTVGWIQLDNFLYCIIFNYLPTRFS